MPWYLIVLLALIYLSVIYRFSRLTSKVHGLESKVKHLEASNAFECSEGHPLVTVPNPINRMIAAHIITCTYCFLELEANPQNIDRLEIDNETKEFLKSALGDAEIKFEKGP